MSSGSVPSTGINYAQLGTTALSAAGSYNALSDMYKAREAAAGLNYQGALDIYSGNVKNTAGMVSAMGTVLSGAHVSHPVALFAAGSTVGGLDGGPNAGYVGGLIKATIALRAAEAIAAS